MSTKEEIHAAYAALCRDVGDLYFQLRHAETTYRSLQERMVAKEKERDTLAAALASAPDQSPKEATHDAAVDAAAG